MAYLPDSGSVLAFQGTVPWSVQGTISGSVVSVNQGSVAAVIVGGSIAAVVAPVANQSVSGTVLVNNGSVVAFQGGAPWQVVSSLAGGIFPISGSVAAVVTNFPANQTVSGTVVATQLAGSIMAVSGSFTPPANQSVSGTIHVDNFSSVVAYQVAGSIMAVSATAAANQSVSGTVGASVIGTVPVTQTTSPWLVASSIAGGIFPISGSVAAVVTNNVTVVSSIAGGIFPISGSVAAVLTTGTAMIGSVAALQAGTVPWLETFSNSSIIAINAGSVVTIIPGSVITLNQGSSILAVPVGSVQTVWLSPSIVGTYAEDAASATGDKGLFILGVRNDTLSSVSSADADYTQWTVGPMGEGIVANAPITKWVYGTTSLVTGASVALIAAQGASIFTYVTGLHIVNPSANNLTGNISTGAGAASVLVYFTAPANGGSNMNFPNPLRSRDNTAILASISGVGSVYLSAQGFIAKT